VGELDRILDAARGATSVLATVVRVAGSTYRRPGARMLFPRGGEPLGLVGGGCLEADLAERAGAIFESGQAHTVVYDMRSPDDLVWGLGLGCNGEVRVLLERLDPADPPAYLPFLEGCVRRRRPGVVATVFAVEGGLAARVGERAAVDEDGRVACRIAGERLHDAVVADAREALRRRRSLVRAYEIDGGRVEALVEYVAPVVSLVVFGAGQDAVPLVRMAAELGWRVTVADHRPAWADRRRFPEAQAVRLVRFDRLDADAPPVDEFTAVVVMTHHFLNDLDLLRHLLSTPAPYLGFLGPRRRLENLLEELASRGTTPADDQRARLYGPVGVDIGSETPEEIALAALAEIHAVLSGRPAGFLRDVRGPLHGGAP
jgi:xanthine/CO dehydrogenase XdhC/CoxF family maturation factor